MFRATLLTVAGIASHERCVFSSQRDANALDVRQAGASAWRAVARVLRSPVDNLCCALFPAPCRLCGESLLRISRVPVCVSCWKNLPEQSGCLCAICGEALGISDFGESEKLLCRICRAAAPPFARAVAHGLYQDHLRSLLHLLKYDGMEPVAGPLGALLARQVQEMEGLPEKLLVVPVPLFRTKQRQRGFNQAETLARAAVKELRKMRPDWELTLATGILERRRSTQSQAGLTPHQRRANLRGAFFAPSPKKLKGADVLLIDDIYTTGTTARACAQTLRRAGANNVYVATVARAQRQEMVQPPAMPAQDVPMHDDVAIWDAGFVPAAPGM
ncbi:ComF family protein [Alloacidobacterium sp.]|uniref:ComF family protein n=1 Tax=Alloacidobacterium sp. TaxID=2951999 RepID=UPI002D5792AE|nr:ComF family protein [Alloacidobacterium sp.]HYK35913.1 ComF family protein [Alloacidobacterium sp.]